MRRLISFIQKHPIDFTLIAFLFFALGVTFSGCGFSVDENLVAQTVESIVERGELTVFNMYQALPGPDGRYYSRYGIGFPLLMIPLWIIGYPLQYFFPESYMFYAAPHFFMMLWGSLLITVFTGWLFYRLCIHIGASSKLGILLTLALIFTTPFWPYSQTLFRLTAATAVLLALFWLVLQHSQQSLWMNRLGMILLIALGLNIREDLVIGICLIGLYGLIHSQGQERFFLFVSFAVGGLIGFGIWCLHNYIRFGHFFIENYADLTFNFPYIISIPGLLFGVRAGLFLYAPLALLMPVAWFAARNKKERGLWWLCAGILIAYLLLYGKSDFWHGGRCWGPRHMYFLLPFAFLPCVWLFRETFNLKVWIATSVFCVWGIFVNWNGTYVHKGQYIDFWNHPSFWEFLQKPVVHPVYNTMDEIQLWWIRMIKVHPLSIWPLVFLLWVSIALFFGHRLWKQVQSQAIKYQGGLNQK